MLVLLLLLLLSLLLLLNTAPVALDTLSLLEHAAGYDAQREEEDGQGQSTSWVVVLDSSPAVGAVVTATVVTE